MSDLTLRLDPEPTAPAQARRALTRVTGLDDDALDTARLLVSELVTNSVRHGRLHRGDTIDLSVRCDPDRLRIEVSDPGRGFAPDVDPKSVTNDAPKRAALEDGGWGLQIVEELSDRWGVDDEGGTVVWFELRSRRGSPTPRTRRSSPARRCA